MIEYDKSLKALNTFGFECRAERYAEAPDEEALVALLDRAERADWPVFILGAGSNLVLTGDVPGLVLRPTARGMAYTGGSLPHGTRVSAGAGMGWHELVSRTIDDGLDGLENLALIPGTVGAAPVQNIGAYGVELAERLHSLRAWHRPSREFRTLRADECGFGYRDSLFKRERDRWIIVEATFELGPHRPRVTGYESLAARLFEQGIVTPSALDVARAVMEIRRARLPDPAHIGNAGSFFQNPIVSAERAATLATRFPDMVMYGQPDGGVKIAAGWLIDQLGFRGYRENGVGVHEHQALVLVHEGDEDGRTLLRLVARIVTAVHGRYGITLEIEPRIVP